MKNLEEIKDIFIVDHGPLCETLQASSGSSAASSKLPQDIIIEGRILPKLEPYCQCSFRIRFTLSHDYPFEPPKLRFLDPMYHPNIDTSGKLCSRLLNERYHPDLSLADIVKNAEQLISSFDEELVINMEAYKEYKNDRDEFNRKTLDFIIRYGYPRT
jgi:ubiquitin-protein ligase